MLKMAYTVTFEFENSYPITKKGIVIGSNYRTCAARAVENISTQQIPSSIVILLERVHST